MIVGVPAEVKQDEYRVAMLPVGVEALVGRGHRVLVQAGAGQASGLSDAAYEQAGAQLLESAAAIYQQADLIVKVKEPQPSEYGLIRRGQTLFTYFHFAASRELTQAMLDSGCNCLAYETLEDEHGRLSLLTPMSEVAGRMSIQQGAKFLEKPQQGRGVLLAGVPGVAPAHVTVLGGGVVGANAAKMAAGFGAQVDILDINMERLRYLDDVMPANVNVLFSDGHIIRDQLRKADLVIGAVLIPGAKAPCLVRREDLQLMKAGAVIVDVAIDQGGCVETSRPTTHRQPIFVVDDVVHYCVTNMPGAVGRTSTFALCNVTLPWIQRLVQTGLKECLTQSRPFRTAANILAGQVTNRSVATAFDLPLADELGRLA